MSSSDLIRLRPATEADLDFVLACEADPEAAPYITRWTRARHAEALTDPDCIHSIIESCLEPSGPARPLGFALVFGACSPNHCIELRRLVCRERGRGHGRAALRAVKRLAFDTLGAHRLWLDVQSRNQRAHALYRAEGFRDEGVLRESVLVDGLYLSMIVLGLLEPEFRALTLAGPSAGV